MQKIHCKKIYVELVVLQKKRQNCNIFISAPDKTKLHITHMHIVILYEMEHVHR